MKGGGLYRACCIGGIAVCFTPAVFADITVQHEPSGTTETIPTLSREGALFAALPRFFEEFGFEWQWDAAARQLTLRRRHEEYVFIQDVPFYRFNEAYFQLHQAPRRAGASLFLPIEMLLDIINTSAIGNYNWNGTSRLLTLHQPPNRILSVVCETKQTGALVTISLVDSAPFDFAHSHSRIDLIFSGIAVDPSRIRAARPADFIDSITAEQAPKSARISLFLSREIEEPEVESVQDLHTILLSLRPKQSAPAAPPAAPTPTPPAAPTSAPAAAPAAPTTEAITTIVIDPGHGGKDPGAIGPGGAKEKDIVLKIALQLRDTLKKKGGITIFCTRETDEFIPLAERTKMANDRGADLFISIHANATGGSRKKKEITRGYKVYFLSEAKNEEDKLAAMRENAVIELEDKPKNYTALQNVLIDLAGNEYLRESQELCILLDQRFERSLRKKIVKFQRGIGQANFWVLNGAYMPSILIEIGFISHASEEKVLLEKSSQRELVSAISEAVVAFKKKYETGL